MVSITQHQSKSKLRADLQRVWRYRELFKNLLSKDIKLQYRGTFLGFVWSLLNPALLVLVYIIAFSYVLKFRSMDNWPLWLLSGILPWMLFTGSTTASANSLLSNASLIHNLDFPRMILPLVIVASHLVQFLFALVAYFLLFLPMGGAFWVGQLLFPIVLALQVLFCVGVGLVVSVLTVYFRDLKHLLTVGLRMLVWLTPIIYTFSLIPESAQPWFRLNPMLPYIMSYHDLLYNQQLPSTTSWAFMGLFSFGFLGLGIWVFRKLQAYVEDAL